MLQQVKEVRTKDLHIRELAPGLPVIYEELWCFDDETEGQDETTHSSIQPYVHKARSNTPSLEPTGLPTPSSTSQGDSPRQLTPSSTRSRSSDIADAGSGPGSGSGTSNLAPRRLGRPRGPREEVQQSNIVEGQRSRRKTEKLRNVAFAYLSQEGYRRSVFYASIVSGTTANRWHLTNLPPLPRSFRSLQNYPMKEEFYAAMTKE